LLIVVPTDFATTLSGSTGPRKWLLPAISACLVAKIQLIATGYMTGVDLY
jgi:hypothetical protein